MSSPQPKDFDSVQSMREARDRLSAEIADMSFDELARWIRMHKFSDPLLRGLAERARRQTDSSDQPPASR